MLHNVEIFWRATYPRHVGSQVRTGTLRVPVVSGGSGECSHDDVSAMTLPHSPRSHHCHQQQRAPGRRVLPDIVSVVQQLGQSSTSSTPTHRSYSSAHLPAHTRHVPVPQQRFSSPGAAHTPWIGGEVLASGGGERGRARDHWGAEGMADGGEEEFRFCCTVAKMRLVIHLQTILRGIQCKSHSLYACYIIVFLRLFTANGCLSSSFVVNSKQYTTSPAREVKTWPN